jgi:hypothetical protein
MALGIILSDFPFQVHAVKEGSQKNHFPSAAVFQKKIASAVIFQESFPRDPPSYRWEAPSHEGRFSFEPEEQ